jgi:hypothetical protein
MFDAQLFTDAEQLGHYGHVCSRKQADPDHVHVFLQSSVHGSLARLPKARIDDLDTGVAK